jgi:hypothetical protein
VAPIGGLEHDGEETRVLMLQHSCVPFEFQLVDANVVDACDDEEEMIAPLLW